jgi:glycosyltransferase involved in cell wall biosynthesis
MMVPVISIVIPMLNAADHVETLITSLLKQEFDQPWEIIAVDNGSNDNSADVARSLLSGPLPGNLVRCEVVSKPSPRGYATPRNAGAQLAEAPLIAFCDADGAVDERWLNAIVRALGHNPVVGSHRFHIPDMATRSAVTAWHEASELPLFQPSGLTFVTTAGLGCTRELFDALGGFDSHFDIGGEDLDFSLRARFQLGVEPVIEHDAIYWSRVSSSPVKLFLKGYRDGRSQIRAYQRHIDQHSVSTSNPFESVLVVREALWKLPRLRRASRKQLASAAKTTGYHFGRALWSVRLGVRSF